MDAICIGFGVSNELRAIERKVKRLDEKAQEENRHR